MHLRHPIVVLLSLNILFNLCSGYKYEKLEQFCSKNFLTKLRNLIHPPELEVGYHKESAIYITQTWNASTFFKLRPHCKFNVDSKRPKSGLYVTITKLKFRSLNGVCSDFVVFTGGGKGNTRRICDEIDAEGSPASMIFDDRFQEMGVEVFIDQNRELVGQLELSMIITAHHQCSSHDDFQCKEQSQDSCISKYFVRDGYLNCPPPCSDEGNCARDDIKSVAIDASNIVLTAITSLIFTMVGVSLCLWLSWKYKECIKLGTTQSRVETPTIELPSAPSIDLMAAETLQQRPATPNDIPPSYESLFPET